MANNYFRFKRFTVYQDLCAMKVGTDGVLLGAWANCDGVERILDIGTGSGLIALMLAQRAAAADIDAIDIEPSAYAQARFNVANSPFSTRITVLHSGLQSFQTNKRYDLLVCNPPFFTQSLKSPDDSRNSARHNDILPFDVLLKSSLSMLEPAGALAVIIPFDAFASFHERAEGNGFHLKRKTTVKPTPNSHPKRVLLEYALTYNNPSCVETDLVIELERHVYSEDYINLTRSFYLNMC